jgi:hypothetical protein
MRNTASKRRRQNIGYAVGASVGLICLIAYLLPGQEWLHVRGPMNIGHDDFRCKSCHVSAPGTIRQQLQATVSYWLGRRATPVDFGHKDVTNEVCLGCHERPNDRHPVYRFLEPRFAKAREKIQPQFCISCHLEHQGKRVTLQVTTYCVNCHEDTKVKKDPLNISHEQLIAQKHWDTCLGCHDFHGNHVMKTKRLVEDASDSTRIHAYFNGGSSPYPKEIYHKAKKEKNDG